MICALIILSPTAEVFKRGMWSTLQELDDPELVKLAQKLPATVLQESSPILNEKVHRRIQTLEDLGTGTQASSIPSGRD